MPILAPALRAELLQGIEMLHLDIEASGLRAMEAYLAQVLKWRGRINLVSLGDQHELISHHALDSLVMLPLIQDGQRVLDIGTGAGFPGMMLAAARPDIHFTLLDSRQRRIEFLRMVNASLGLGNLALVCSRVEAFAGRAKQSAVQPAANFDTLFARAVASLRELVEMTAALRMPGQRLVAMKGQHPEGELAQLEEADCFERIRSVHVEQLEVPFLDASRHAVIIEF